MLAQNSVILANWLENIKSDGVLILDFTIA